MNSQVFFLCAEDLSRMLGEVFVLFYEKYHLNGVSNIKRAF